MNVSGICQHKGFSVKKLLFHISENYIMKTVDIAFIYLEAFSGWRSRPTKPYSVRMVTTSGGRGWFPSPRQLCGLIFASYGATLSSPFRQIFGVMLVGPWARVRGCRGGGPRRWTARTALRRATWRRQWSLSSVMWMTWSGRWGILVLAVLRLWHLADCGSEA
jgi:hypothetical protein